LQSDFVVLGQIVNASVVQTAQGAVVIDTSSTPEAAQEVYAEATRQGHVLFVINTHEHGDHLAGNSLFACPVISSRKAREEMLSNTSLASVSLPTITFDTRMDLFIGEKVELTHFGGHCPGASVVFFPERKLLFVGDLVFNKRIPYMGMAEFTTWIEALSVLETWNAEVVVPGHGPMGGKEVLTEQRRWLETFIEEVRTWSVGGLSQEEIFVRLLGRHTVVERWHPMLRRAVALALGERLEDSL